MSQKIRISQDIKEHPGGNGVKFTKILNFAVCEQI